MSRGHKGERGHVLGQQAHCARRHVTNARTRASLASANHLKIVNRHSMQQCISHGYYTYTESYFSHVNVGARPQYPSGPSLKSPRKPRHRRHHMSSGGNAHRYRRASGSRQCTNQHHGRTLATGLDQPAGIQRRCQLEQTARDHQERAGKENHSQIHDLCISGGAACNHCRHWHSSVLRPKNLQPAQQWFTQHVVSCATERQKASNMLIGRCGTQRNVHSRRT